MIFNPQTFLTHVKNTVMGGGMKADLVTPRSDAGYLVDNNNLLDSSILAASVTFIADGDGYPALNAAAGITAVAAFSFQVPRDYDEATDELHLKVVAKMAGATDVPTLTLVAKNRVIGAAAGAITTQPTTATPTAALSTTATKFTFKFVGRGLKRDNVVLFTLTSAAHATDALQVQNLGVAYRSTLVSYHESDGTRDGKNGAFLR